MNALTIIDHASLPAALQIDIEAAADFARAEKAEATRRAYESDFRIFNAWCRERGLNALPASPAAVAAFLGYEAQRGVRPSTISRRVAAIRHVHKLASEAVPTDDERVKAVMRGISRTIGAAPAKKAAADSTIIIAMCANAGTKLTALRDRALLLLGFAIAARRSELVALDLSDIQETKDGLLITIRRSKTDQEGIGATVAVPFGNLACPVKALRDWLAAARIEDGPVFRSIRKGGKVEGRLSDRSVAAIVKAHAARLGLDPNAFSGHSLRAGFATTAAAQGRNLFKIMEVTRHKSVDTLRGYVRNSDLFKDHAGAGLL